MVEVDGTVIGRVFDDRYEVVRKLGSGGMADVYLANDRLLGRQVALKVLSARYANDDQFVERFRREASSAASLNHPNIVQIYDRGEAEGTYYIAMEYLEGRSLKEIIVKYAPLSTELAMSISTQILEALRFAHRRDVIHRDIKPQNIIVDNDGRVKVTDFGIARAGSVSTMTEAGSILGTAHYLSPEQAQGLPVEAASDLYSLGVVMYEMLTGKLPFDGDNPVSIAMQHAHDPAPSPRAIVPDLPENVEAVVLRALAKVPMERYLTAQAMLDDLARAQNGEQITVPASYSDDATRVMSPAAAAAAAAAVSQQTTVRRKGEDAPPFGPEAQYEPPRRPSVWPWILVIILILALGGAGYGIFSNWGNGADAAAPVPSLLGLTEAQARQKVEDAGFKLKTAGSQVSADYDSGKVCRQSPDQGEKFAAGTLISVWLSSGKGKIQVPDVVGKTSEMASNELGKLKLDVKIDQKSTDKDHVGKVLLQNPEANSFVDAGATITITVGIAADTIKVPRVIDLQKDIAVTQLTNFGLQSEVQVVDSDKPGGTVIDQSPKEGEEVAKDTKVILYVSNAPVVTTVVVPPVGGMNYQVEDAVAILKSYNLKYKITLYPMPDMEPGIVIQQNPAAGAEVEKGTVIELLVSQLPPSTTTTTEPPTTTTTSPPTTEPPTTTPSVTEY